MTFRCPFCSFQTHDSALYEQHHRNCISTWKHVLIQPDPPSPKIIANALMSCFCMIERQNEAIISLRAELARARPYVKRRRKIHHAAILSMIKCPLRVPQWLAGIPIPNPVSIPEILEHGIQSAVQTFLGNYTRQFQIPSFECEPLEIVTVPMPFFVFTNQPTVIYIYTTTESVKEPEWIILTNERLVSILEYIYSRVTQACLSQSQVSESTARAIELMEVLNQNPPSKSVHAHKQYFVTCLQQCVQSN